jgi:thioesterase domain-containing protein
MERRRGVRAANILRLAAVAGLISILGSNLTAAQTVATAPAPAKHGPVVSQRAHIYLLKGLADVFSSGMDALQAKLARQGIVAQVRSHAVVDSLADDLAKEYRAGARGPVIIVGHSLGADATVDMARRLYEYKIPVALIVSLGPLSSPRVPPNVARVVNYFQSNSAWHGQMIPGDGFHGQLTNIDLANQADINHFNIDKIDRLHTAAITRIRAVLAGGQKPATAVAAPANAKPREVGAAQRASVPAASATAPAARAN